MLFKSRGTEAIYDGYATKAARAVLPAQLVEKAREKLVAMAVAKRLDDLRLPPSNRLEALHGDREGQYSVRISRKYRICFRWVQGEAIDVEIVDYH